MEKELEGLTLPESVPDTSANRKHTPFETLLTLKRKYPKISLRHLGKLVGISAEAVRLQFLKRGINFETGEITAVEEYRAGRAEILASKQIEVLNHLTPEKLKSASAQQLTYTYGVLYDKERLERGQSTGNISVSVSGLLERMQGDIGPVIDIQGTVIDPIMQARREAEEE